MKQSRDRARFQKTYDISQVDLQHSSHLLEMYCLFSPAFHAHYLLMSLSRPSCLSKTLNKAYYKIWDLANSVRPFQIPPQAPPTTISSKLTTLGTSLVDMCCAVLSHFSRVQLFATPWTAAPQTSLFNTNSQSLPKLLSTESVMPSNHLILCHPLLLPPSIFPSIRVFSNESALRIRWPKYWSFSFSIIPSNEHPGLISFRMDCLDLLAVQGTLKSLLQHHSSKASVLRCSAIFIVQLSHPYMTT